MKTFRIYETGNNTGKKWYYAQQKFLFWYRTPEFNELSQDIAFDDGSRNPRCKRFNSKDELVKTIKSVLKKDFEREEALKSIYHKVIDEIDIFTFEAQQ